MQNPEIKDALRMMAVLMLDSIGYDPEVLLFRFQTGTAIYMTPGFLPFF